MNFTPIVPPKSAEHWLYEALRRVSQQLNMHVDALNAVGRGEQPDGSGDPLLDLSQYFRLPGRPGGQTGYGGTGSAQDLTFSSTKAPTKGLIYLGISGSARVAFDETNCYLGVGTDSPGVRVHANTASAGTTTTGQVGTPMYRGSYGGTTLFELIPIQFGSGQYDIAVRGVNAGFQVLSSTDATAGVRIVPAGGRAYIQTGIKDAGGNPSAMNMTLGGIGAQYGTHLGVAFTQTHFLGGDAVYPKVGMGVGVNPADFSSWKGVLAVRGNSTSEPALIVSHYSDGAVCPALEMRYISGNSFGARHVSFEYDNTSGSGRVTIWSSESDRAGFLACVSSPVSGKKLSLYDRNSRRALCVDSWSLWADAVTSTIIDFGQTVSGHNGVVFTGIDAGVLTRFALISGASLVTNVYGSALAAPTALWHVRNAGAVGTTLLSLQRVTGQTGNLTEWLDSNGTSTLSYVDRNGAFSLGNSSSSLYGVCRLQISFATGQSTNVFSIAKDGYSIYRMQSNGNLLIGGSSTVAANNGYEKLTIQGSSVETENLFRAISGIAGATDLAVNCRAVLTTGRIKTAVLFTDDNATPASSKLLAVSVASITAGQTRTWTSQDSDGTVAYLTDTYKVPYVAKTATYAITTSDYIIDCTANSFTVTLPTAVGAAGRKYVIKNSGTGTTITVDTTSAQTIDDASTQSVPSDCALVVASDGANWIII